MLKYIYEIPLFIFIILAIFTIIKLYQAQKLLEGGAIGRSYRMLMYSGIFFMLWAVDHIYHDLVPLPPELKDFFHFVISHGFLLISMTFIAIAAGIIKKTVGAGPKQ